MNSYNYNQHGPIHTVRTLQDAAAITGLDPDEILHLLDSGLEIGDLIVYVEATVSNRMH